MVLEAGGLNALAVRARGRASQMLRVPPGRSSLFHKRVRARKRRGSVRHYHMAPGHWKPTKQESGQAPAGSSPQTFGHCVPHPVWTWPPHAAPRAHSSVVDEQGPDVHPAWHVPESKPQAFMHCLQPCMRTPTTQQRAAEREMFRRSLSHRDPGLGAPAGVSARLGGASAHARPAVVRTSAPVVEPFLTTPTSHREQACQTHTKPPKKQNGNSPGFPRAKGPLGSSRRRGTRQWAGRTRWSDTRRRH